MSAHLFVDISSHGFGHLAISAPVLLELRARIPDVRLTVRSGLASRLLRGRLGADFTHIEAASEFGFVQNSAISIDHEATRLAYLSAHDNFAQRVVDEAVLLSRLKPDLVFSNISYLPLAGAARAGIPAVAMCSLNWFDLLKYFYGQDEWAESVIAEVKSAYDAADLFLAVTPSMAMADLPRRRVIGPVATVMPAETGLQLRRALKVSEEETLVLFAMGGFEYSVPMDQWPLRAGLRYLVPESWNPSSPAAISYGRNEFSFGSLLRAADVVLTKPGYGTFVEAACSGVPVMYVRREDWPEQDFLIPWLAQHGVCGEISREELLSGAWSEKLGRVLQTPRPSPVFPSGTSEAVDVLAGYLAR